LRSLNCCLPRSHSTSRAPSSTASTSTTACSARPARRQNAISKPPTGPSPSAPRASASIITTSASGKPSPALENDYAPEDLVDGVWREIKLHYIGLLSGHKQPELAETFFNSVSCQILHRSYYHNDFMFVRPVISTEYIETEELLPTYRVYYPAATACALH
jgi:hypothetical protein